jgi:hypothetical protein
LALRHAERTSDLVDRRAKSEHRQDELKGPDSPDGGSQRCGARVLAIGARRTPVPTGLTSCTRPKTTATALFDFFEFGFFHTFPFKTHYQWLAGSDSG